MENERIALPNKDEILAMNNLADLRDFEAELEQTISKIQVDLDYVGGDDNWYARARTALSYHNTCLKRIRQQIYYVSKGKSVPDAMAKEETKVAKIEAKNKHKELVKSQQELSNEKKAIDLENRKLNLIEKLSYLHIFKRTAKMFLLPEDYQKVCDEADRAIMAVLTNSITIHPKDKERVCNQ